MHRSVTTDAAATRRLLAAVAGVLLVAVPLYLVLPRPAAEAMYQVVAWSSIGAFLVGALHHRAPFPPVLAMAAGWACFVGGDLLFAIYDVLLHDTPFPSLADVLYLAGYLLLLTDIYPPVGDEAPALAAATA